MGMKELRELALAYRRAGIENITTILEEFFCQLKPDQKDSVAFKEFSMYMENLGLPELCSEEFFSKLKVDDERDKLNEMDVVTLFYIIYGQLPFCHGQCKKLIEGNSCLICVECYVDDHKIDNEESFNLCTTCYNDGKYEHHHREFLDQNLLLRHLRKKYVKNYSNEPVADSSKPSATTHDVAQDLQLVAANSSKPSAHKLKAGSSSQSAIQYAAEPSTQSANDQALVVRRRPDNNKHIEFFHTIMAIVNTGLAVGAALGCSIM